MELKSDLETMLAASIVIAEQRKELKQLREQNELYKALLANANARLDTFRGLTLTKPQAG
jgi:hypothetical protein